MPNFMIAQLDDLPQVKCPCGFSKRAFADDPTHVASLHVVDIQEDAKSHYHKGMTEIYLVLEGEGMIELDGEQFPVRPLTAIYIKPGCPPRFRQELIHLNVVRCFPKLLNHDLIVKRIQKTPDQVLREWRPLNVYDLF